MIIIIIILLLFIIIIIIVRPIPTFFLELHSISKQGSKQSSNFRSDLLVTSLFVPHTFLY